MASDQTLIAQHARRRFAMATIDDMAQAAEAGTKRLDLDTMRIVDQQDVGFGMVQRMEDLARGPAYIARIERAASPRHGALIFQIAVGIEGQHPDPVTWFHSQAA